MALEIQKYKGPAAAAFLADRRLYLSRDDRLVEEGSTDAAYLLAAQGSEIPADEAARLRLELVDGRVVQRSSTAVPSEAAPSSQDSLQEPETGAQPPAGGEQAPSAPVPPADAPPPPADVPPPPAPPAAPGKTTRKRGG